MGELTAGDRAAIIASGRDPEAVDRAIGRLLGEQPWTRIERAATVGDGIVQLTEAEGAALQARALEAAEAGRVSTFVPASGAATRLCQALWQTWDTRTRTGDWPDAIPAEVADVLSDAPRMALWSSLVAHGAREGDAASVLDAMFGEGGLDLHHQPKALVPFHRYGDDVRTALDEHLVEAGVLAADAEGMVDVHLTVAPAHREAVAEAAARMSEAMPGQHVDLSLSVQDPATDHPALDDDTGEIVRTDDGAVHFRPGGHGALLANLAACGGDVVLVKNIDNVVRADLRGPVVPWRRRLVGLLVTHQARAWELVEALELGGGVEPARAFCREVLGIDPGDDPAALIDRLHRPWRVAGMVVNTGQPGGGPFWAASPDGVSLQIVEAAQIDLSDPAQAEVVSGATHFNPVDMALGLRDRHGRPWDLLKYTDPDAVIVTHKVREGRRMRALEHPGLWNGQMARWNTVFVEIPPMLFQPVKRLADLLGEGHTQPARSPRQASGG